MVTTITDVLNMWNEMGVFSYVIPFLLIFAVVFAILKKSKVLGDENDGMLVIVAVALGLLSLQFDKVPEFFAIIFPRFGVAISVILVALIMFGVIKKEADGDFNKAMVGFIWVAVIGLIIWSFSSWDQWGDQFGFGGWFADNFWALLVLGVVIAVIVLAGGKKKGTTSGG